jgi:hypothetical protein
MRSIDTRTDSSHISCSAASSSELLGANPICPALSGHRHDLIAEARETGQAEPRTGAEDGDGSALDPL